MQNRTEIIRSPASLNYQIILFTICYTLLAALCIFILLVPFTVFDRNVFLWFLLFTATAVVFYILSVYMLKKTWNSNKYYFAKDCLIITSGVSSLREDVYRYETITNVSLQQTSTAKTRGYGMFVLNIDSKPQTVILKDVVYPNDVLDKLQAHIQQATQRLNR